MPRFQALDAGDRVGEDERVVAPADSLLTPDLEGDAEEFHGFVAHRGVSPDGIRKWFLTEL
jgi:hypothetical protein